MRRLPFLTLAATFAAMAAASPATAKCPLRHPSDAPAAAKVVLPALTGRVVDNAHVLSDRERARLAARLTALERRTSDQLVVVTLSSLGGAPIEAVGLRLGSGWGIGRAGLDNGVLLIVAPNDHKVRIEVGCGLEGLLTDARAASIIQEKLIPLLRQADYNDAAEVGVASIAAILESDLRRPQPRLGGGA
ncbi:MAG TPA: TPM domain-containing protein [Allosphingosinicella sp.]|nr:TPM domain-containing protein [Allosphingosinicella sp.]